MIVYLEQVRLANKWQYCTRTDPFIVQRHVYYAHEKLITRSSSIKKYEMARIVYDDWKEPLLPIISESPTAILQSPLRDWLISPGSSDSECDIAIALPRRRLNYHMNYRHRRLCVRPHGTVAARR